VLNLSLFKIFFPNLEGLAPELQTGVPMQVVKVGAHGPGQLSGVQDLCVRCRFADRCVFCTPLREAVDRCSGFMAGRSERSQLFVDAETEATGLCANCSLRAKCNRERPMSGVWHCEDYC